jgi:hypothetical protein
MAGATIGSACALLSYSIYYKNPFVVSSELGIADIDRSEALKELGNPKDVYGALERDTLGDIRLGDAEEVPEGEEQA